MAISLPDARQLSDEVLEAIRLRALRGCELGFTEAAVADLLGVSGETVSRGWTAYALGGLDATPSDRPGRPVGSGRTLSEDQARHIQQQIDDHSPGDLGIPAALWTRKAVRDLIREQYEIDMPVRTGGEYLKRWGYTAKVPRRHAKDQDPEGAIAPVPSFSGEIVDLPTQTGLSDDEKREGILKMRRFLGELGVTQPTLRTTGIASMDHATVFATLLATPFAASLLPLTLRLLPIIAQVAQQIVAFRAAGPTPSACHRFETQLQATLRELGRILVEWTYNHLEPDDRHLMPGHLRFDGDWYRRRAKTPNRGVATLFG